LSIDIGDLSIDIGELSIAIGDLSIDIGDTPPIFLFLNPVRYVERGMNIVLASLLYIYDFNFRVFKKTIAKLEKTLI
jgi:hypothetical protein